MPKPGSYHDWTARRRWWFDTLIHALLIVVFLLGVVECAGTLKP